VYEQAWMEHCQAVGPMRRTVVALLALSLSSACGIIMVGEPVQKLDISAEDDAEGNLKAVRTMFKGSGMRQLGEEKMPGTSQPVPSEAASNFVQPSEAPLSAPSAAGQSHAPAKLPFTPTAPNRPAGADRSVPAYTTPAPVGPDYSGSLRCTPDGMGGQRCLGR
jgi:hypothetical protein